MMRKLFAAPLLCFILMAGAGLAVAKSAYTPEESKVSLNGEWLFKTDPYNRGLDNSWYAPDVDASGWDTMTVPGNWDIENEYADYIGYAWYRTTFEASEAWRDKAVRLFFESVYNDAEVWINGESLGEHVLGFLPFWFDVQDHLRFGEPNTVALRVNNVKKRGAVWNWGGIRRPVRLEVTESVRLETHHITAVPDLEAGSASVDVAFSISNQSGEEEQVSYEVVVLKDGEEIWTSGSQGRRDHMTVSPEEGARQSVSFELQASEVDLWHFNNPHLYTSKVRLYRNGNEIHSQSDRFGIRKVEVEGETFKLNGEAVRTVGFNLVAEDRTTGNTLPLWRIKEDVDLMKSLGANMARLSHKPLPKDFLDYLDEKGIMVFEEVSTWQKDLMVDPDHPVSRHWLEKMIELRYNHPSIIGWSVGNEIGFHHHNAQVMEYVQEATDRARELDPNRLATYVSSSADRQEVDPVEYSDMILFTSYGSWSDRVSLVNQLHPGKPVFMAEYGDHLNDEDLNEAQIDFNQILSEYRGKPFMSGVSLWTFNDYRSLWQAQETWTTPPSQNRTWGVVDVFRQKKRPFFDVRREYAPVRTFSVQTDQEVAASIELGPRDVLDIPAYTMEGYALVWSVADKAGNVLDGGIEDLPVIEPGDAELKRSIRWQASDAEQLRVDLLDPQQYSVRDTTIYFSAPEPPEIISIHTARNRARVIFESSDRATNYRAYYGQGGFSEQTGSTINDYIEIEDLEDFGEYQIKAVAVNNAGESEPSEAVTAQLDRQEFPPIIRTTEPADGSFFVGYSVDRSDYMYEVKYGTASGEYTNHFELRNPGVLQVPGLENGQTYYYRMRNRGQSGFASAWTHEVAVTPDGGIIADTPRIRGVIRGGDRAVLKLQPVEKATGYEVSVRQGGQEVQRVEDSRAQIEYILVEGLSPQENYTFLVRSLNEYGLSDPVSVEFSDPVTEE